MMTPIEREVHLVRRTRYFVHLACRAVGVLLVAGACFKVFGIVLGILQASAWSNMAAMTSDVFVYLLAFGILGLVPGIALLIWSANIAKWLTPWPKLVCLRCDYDASRSGSNKCPECGAVLGWETDTDLEETPP